jgi:hypothetical protein
VPVLYRILKKSYRFHISFTSPSQLLAILQTINKENLIRSSKMNKKWIVSLLLVAVAIFTFTSVVAAKGPNPPEDAPGYGYVHDYLISYAADALGISMEDLEIRLDAGETLAQIAFSEGIEDYRSFMLDARSYVNEQLLEAGINIQGWNKDTPRGNRSMNAQAGTCTGTCMEDGTGTPQGRGFRGGR